MNHCMKHYFEMKHVLEIVVLRLFPLKMENLKVEDVNNMTYVEKGLNNEKIINDPETICV